MLSRHMTDYPTVEEVLALSAFSGCRILGGSAGCQRRVRGVNLTDTPDYARWLSPGELLLTTGFALAGDEAAIEALLPTAAERGLAGVGIKPGRFLPDPLPGSLVREADRLGLPLIALPGDARFAALSAAVSREIARRKIPSEQARRLEEYVRHLLSGPLEDPAAEARQAGAFGLHPERGHILVRAGGVPPREMGLLESVGAELGLPAWCLAAGEEALLILECPGDRFAPEKALFRRLEALCRDQGWVCGMSRPHRGAAGFAPADRSARAALAQARAQGMPCATGDPAGLSLLLEEGESGTADFVSRQLGALLTLPEPRREELLETLAQWLACMGNQRQMARQMHLHYNTVSYRLRQLWAQLGAEPGDPAARLGLEAALYLLREPGGETFFPEKRR